MADEDFLLLKEKKHTRKPRMVVDRFLNYFRREKFQRIIENVEIVSFFSSLN